MVFAVRYISAGEGTFLARVGNRSLWQCLLAVMGRLVEGAKGLAKGHLELGVGLAALDEEKRPLTAIMAMLDEAMVTAVEETEIPAEVKVPLGKERREMHPLMGRDSLRQGWAPSPALVARPCR
jgi:hypothetical protein